MYGVFLDLIAYSSTPGGNKISVKLKFKKRARGLGNYKERLKGIEERQKKHNKCKLRLSGQVSRFNVEVFTATITFASYRASQGFKSPLLYFLMCPWS